MKTESFNEALPSKRGLIPSLTALASLSGVLFGLIAFGSGHVLGASILVPPSVTTGAATNITENSATLNGNLAVAGGIIGVAAVTAGAGYALALRSDGTLWSWGYNMYFQLGLGDNTDRWSPTQVGADNQWVAVTAGYYHTLALRSDGTLWSWGYNGEGELGLGDTTNRLSPTQVSSITIPPCIVWFQWGTTTGYGNETASVSMTITGPFSASISGLSPLITYHFRAVAQNSRGTSYGADNTFTTQVTVRGVSVSISPSDNSGANGATLIYTVTVNNTSNVSENYSLTATDNASPSWSPNVFPTSFVVAAFGSDNVTLSVTIPASAIGGTSDDITVTATSQADNTVSGSASCTAQATVTMGVSVSISPTSQSGFNGATLTYTVTVNNTGNVSDNYYLTLADNAGWSPSVSPTSLIVSPGGSGNVTLSVTVPSNAIGGTSDNIIVTATSQTDTNVVSASDSSTAYVAPAPAPSGISTWLIIGIVILIACASIGVATLLSRKRQAVADRARSVQSPGGGLDKMVKK